MASILRSSSVGESTAPHPSGQTTQLSADRAAPSLRPRDQAPLASALMRGLTSGAVSSVAASAIAPGPIAPGPVGADAAASGSPGRSNAAPSRSRRHGHSVRFEASTPTSAGTNGIAIQPASSPNRVSAPSLTQRRRLSQRESAVTDARLARRFPSGAVRVLSAIHLTVCLMVLFVQFWTSSRVHAQNVGFDYWARTVNTYGYMCALLSGLAGCSGIALYLQQSKIRAISFLSMSVSTALICCYLLTFYTSYFAEIRAFVSAQGCMEKYDKHPSFKLPFALMTILTLLEFFFAFLSVLIVSTIINRARACWWSCDPCAICQFDEDIENSVEDEVDETNANLDDVAIAAVAPSSRLPFASLFEMPPAYFDQPPPYKP